MATTASPKTWAQLETAIYRIFRLWKRASAPVITDSLEGRTTAQKNKAAHKRDQTDSERRVCFSFVYSGKAEQYRVVIVATFGARAIDNLARIAQALETMRMAEVHGIEELIMKMYRQMYPLPTETRQEPKEPLRERILSSGPYAMLHIANDAPLEVAEAAYRALSKRAHPDAGGNHTAMLALNAAIEAIRKVKSK